MLKIINKIEIVKEKRVRYILSRTGTIFHESLIHVQLFAEDYKDDRLLNDSNISGAIKKKVNLVGGDLSQGYHHESAKLSTSIFQKVGIPALISIYKKNMINVTRQQLQKEHEGH